MKFLLKAAAIFPTALTCIPILAGDPLRVALVGDPQVDDAVEMGYARKSVYRELAGRNDIDLCIFLGDLVNDNIVLLPESVRVIDSLPFPCLMIPGNHDRDVYHGPKASIQVESASGSQSDAKRQRDLATWRRTIGYVDTAFIRGNVRFVLMNNVRAADGGMTDYEGGFTEPQKHWLDSVMSHGSAGYRRAARKTPALTILATHIPVSQMKGRDSVLALIPNLSRMLFVSGHTHYVSRDYISNSDDGMTTSELIAGAACGSWWRGFKDADGVPYALQSCGAPRGFFIADIKHSGDYRLTYKSIGKPESEHLSVWAIPEEAGRSTSERLMNPGTSSDSVFRYRIYVNVFGGAPDGVVKISIPHKVRQHSERRQMICERSFATAPEVEAVVRFNASMSREYRKAHRYEFIPLRRKPSPHLWQSADTFQGNSPAYVNVRYRDSHMRLRSTRIQVNAAK